MTTKHIAQGLFGQFLLLLMLYTAAILIAEVKVIGNDPLALSIPYHQISAFSHVLLNLAIVTGLLGAGLHLTEHDNQKTPSVPLMWVYRAWTALLVLAFLAGVLGLQEGRHRLELLPLLDVAQAVLVAAFIVLIMQRAVQRNATLTVWAVGISMSLIGTLLGLVPSADVVGHGVLGGWAVGLNTTGCILAALAVSFWLNGENENGLYISAGLVAVAGMFLTLASINTLNADDFSRLLSAVGFVFIPLAYLVFGAFAYKQAHGWHLLGVTLLVASGLIGGIQALPSINLWVQGTRLTDLQMTLPLWAVAFVILAAVQQASAAQGKLRGAAFWLVAAGSVVSALALAGTGLVQVYMERILSIGYLDTQVSLIPLYLFWVAGGLLIAVGIALYVAHHFLRRA